MRIGFSLPQIGPATSADAIVQVAKRAEELGYDSLWVLDRLLVPVNPQSDYPADPDGKLPDAYSWTLDKFAVI